MKSQSIIQHFNQELRSDNTLHVIGVISNPARWHSRVRIAKEWIKHMEATPNVNLHIVELAHGDRSYQVTEAGNPQHLQLRTHGSNECWHKENLINEGVRTLIHRKAKYICCSDMDVFWSADSGWALETIHQLQVYPAVQPWKDCIDRGPNGDIMLNDKLQPLVHTSFCYVHQRGVPKQTNPTQPYKYAHTGFAWAYTRKFWESTRGMMDRCIIGSADHLQAWACIGKVDHAIHGLLPEGFKRMAHQWQRDAMRITHGNVGFVQTSIDHLFHGSKKNRQYRERNLIFVDHKFDPETDLGYDEQGLLQIIGKPAMEEEIRMYNRDRREDSNDE